MANHIPQLPTGKIRYFKEQLYRELSHMFEWTGLPQTVPQDYIERNLIRHGYILYYEDEEIGQDVLRCEVQGYNRHDVPVSARTFTPNTINERTTITRNIKRLADSENAVELFNPQTDGVLITNMATGGSWARGGNMGEIVDFFAHRLALAQQAFDTNLLWANVPYLFQVSSDEMKLSIERMFAQIFEGKPFVVVDKELMADNKDRAGLPAGIQFIGKELMDTQNEIMMKFRETVGFNTAGVDKAERVNTLEIKSNDQHTASVLEIMLYQRQKACEDINAFFNTSLSVELVGQKEMEAAEQEAEEQGGIENGASDSGAATSTEE